MNTAISLEEQALQEQIVQAREQISGLEQGMQAMDAELEGFSGERHQYRLLRQISDALDELTELGADRLFWGERADDVDSAQHRAHVLERIVRFENKVASIEEKRSALNQEIQAHYAKLGRLREQAEEVREQEDRRKHEFVIEREVTKLPYRPMVMPWASEGEDKWRFRRALLIVLLFTTVLGYLVPIWKLPEPERAEVVEIPERLAQLIKKPEPVKPPPKVEEPKPEPEEKKPEEQPKEDKPKKDVEVPKPTPEETKTARTKAESTGVLAFKQTFADLFEETTDAKLGASARLGNAGQTTGTPTRSIVSVQAQSSSGGIATAALSRDIGGGGGERLAGVQFSRVESSLGDLAAEDRPLSGGPGPSRTDEEIQIVFDRYKAALYRIYNTELRKNPTLQGKVVLRLTIEPDGQVSFCKVESSEMPSPELLDQIVARVNRFNFGPKEGVPAVTILYPIDFLPAS